MKKIFVCLLAVCLFVGCSSNENETQPEEIQDGQVDQIEEPKIKKEQYDVIWGTYDHEWVYSDEWSGEGFKNFDEAMNVLNQCMREIEEEIEMCVYNYLNHKKDN